MPVASGRGAWRIRRRGAEPRLSSARPLSPTSGGFIQEECFTLRRLPFSIPLAEIVGLVVGNAKGRVERQQVRWLMRLKKLPFRLQEFVVVALCVSLQGGGENATFYRAPRWLPRSRGGGGWFFRQGNRWEG